MNGYDIIKQALEILGKARPDTIFIGGDVRTDYLLFAVIDEEIPDKEMEAKLRVIGVVRVGKYECWGIEREFLWDIRYQ